MSESAHNKTTQKELAKRLRRAVQTANNDDLTLRDTPLRKRHNERVNAMLDAAEYLDRVQDVEDGR